MTQHDRAVQPTDGLDGAASKALARAEGPAWLIAPRSGRVLAANPSGTAILGLPPAQDGATVCLDRAMPAMTDLSRVVGEVADAPASGRTLLRLRFWTSHGIVEARCTCSPAGRTPGGEPTLLVMMADSEPAPREPGPGRAAADAPHELKAATAHDAETLAAIASRIRETLAQPKSPAPASGAIATGAEPMKGALPTAAPQVSGLAGEASDEHMAVPQASRDAMAKLAHELRTPLSAIAALAEVIRDERFGPDAGARYREYAGNIHDSACHALSLVTGLMEDARSARAHQSMTFVEVDVEALLTHCVATVKPVAENAGLTLAHQPAARLPRLIADAQSLRQIVLNLLANALKFNSAGGTVAVQTHCTLNGPLTIEVRDDGPGIDPSQAQSAMSGDALPALANHHRITGGGLGLGLPLVRALAQANGGRFEITGSPGEGTRARIVFPPDRVLPV